MKRTIYERLKRIFKESNKEDWNPDDEWLNENILLYIKNNSPEKSVGKYMSKRKVDCEFCGI